MASIGETNKGICADSTIDNSKKEILGNQLASFGSHFRKLIGGKVKWLVAAPDCENPRRRNTRTN
jgi:hypothetical protein